VFFPVRVYPEKNIGLLLRTLGASGRTGGGQNAGRDARHADHPGLGICFSPVTIKSSIAHEDLI